MATTPKPKINIVKKPKEEAMAGTKETRITTLKRGFTQGMLKGTVEQVLEYVANPICDFVIPKIHEIHPSLEMADPAIRAGVESATLILVAEACELCAPMLSKIPGLNISPEEGAEKMQIYAVWLRKFAAERMGEKTAETLAEIIPMVAEKLTEGNMLEIIQSIGQEVEQNAEAPVRAAI